MREGHGGGVPTRELAAYVHAPFCARRCPYCDFPTVAGRDHEITAYTAAMLAELERCPLRGSTATTVYFGGGTPTHVGSTWIATILGALRKCFRVPGDAEITVEANPASSDAACFDDLRSAGVGRISIGVQSFADRTLAKLGRLHTASDARNAIAAARRARFTSISLDLMFGVYGQTREEWRNDLHSALREGAQHISTYALTIAEGTPFARDEAMGRPRTVDEDTWAAMYEEAISVLTAAGYEHYEISNFALPGHRCRHNGVYWRNAEYIGFGSGAASYVDGVRSTNVADPAAYVRLIDSGKAAMASSERLEEPRALGESLMLGLRVLEGVDLEALAVRHGQSTVEAITPALRALQARGLLVFEAGSVRLTHRGLFLADTATAELLGDEVGLRADSNR